MNPVLHWNVAIQINFWVSVHQKKGLEKKNCPQDLSHGLLSKITKPSEFQGITAINEGGI